MIKYINCIALLAVVVINYIASSWGINNFTTGEISNMYPTLFTPEGYTFSIWGVIYFGLALFCYYQFKADDEYNRAVNALFILTCILNIAWLFLWHHLNFSLSVLVMVGLLLALIILYQRIFKLTLPKKQIWFLKVPFSIYLGWISVATMANIAVFLKVIGIGSYPEMYTIFVIIISFTLALLMMGFRHDLFFSLTIGWGLAGIIVKYWMQPPYLNIVITSVVGLILIAVYSLVKQPRYFKNN